jgi:hypothetical protein
MAKEKKMAGDCERCMDLEAELGRWRRWAAAIPGRARTEADHGKVAVREFLAGHQRRWRKRGVQMAIAKECYITETSVASYRKGESCPRPEFWPVIERHLGLAPGSIAAVADGHLPVE